MASLETTVAIRHLKKSALHDQPLRMNLNRLKYKGVVEVQIEDDVYQKDKVHINLYFENSKTVLEMRIRNTQVLLSFMSSKSGRVHLVAFDTKDCHNIEVYQSDLRLHR